MEAAEAEAGTMPLEIQPLDLGALIVHTIDLFNPMAEDRQVTVEFRHLYRGAVLADPTRLRLVLSNLLDNALKFSFQGGHVWIEVERWLHPLGPEAAITFRDDGPGISPDDLPRIWDRLFRGEVSRTTSRGLGLGLSLVKAVAEAHGGRVQAGNAPGAGAQITVCLPLYPALPKVARSHAGAGRN